MCISKNSFIFKKIKLKNIKKIASFLKKIKVKNKKKKMIKMPLESILNHII